VALALLGSPLVSHSAHAQLGGCRDDPAVILTNGAVIDLSASISDSTSDVQNVVYSLHGPAGTGILLLIDPNGLLLPKDTFRYYADDPANTYDTYTVVHTGLKRIPVSTSMLMTSPLALELLGTRTASGYSGQTLHERL